MRMPSPVLTMSESVVCWRCIKRPVDAPLQVCKYCSRLGLGRRGERLEDWTVEQLADTQKWGEVPEGRWKWQQYEIPVDPGYFQ